MAKADRLILIVPTVSNQSAAISHLLDKDGLCTCGRYLKRTDGKFALAQIHTQEFPDPKFRNTMTIAMYCWECSNLINNTLKSLKNRFRNPEPEQARHEGGQ